MATLRPSSNLPGRGASKPQLSRAVWMDSIEPTLRTTIIEHAHHHLCAALGGHFIRRDRAGTALDFEHRRADWGGISFHRVRYGTPVLLDVESTAGCFLLQLTLRGRTSTCVDRLEYPSEAGSLAMVSAGRRFSKRWEAEAEQLMLRIDRRLMERGVGIALGDHSPRPVCFDPAPMTAEQAPALYGMIDMLCSAVDTGCNAYRRPPVAGAIAASLVQLILHELPSDRSEALACAASPACPSYVRRAERFIEQFAEQPITVSDIAGHCGVTSRTLSAGFCRFRNISPMEKLRSVRLERARASLMAGHSNTNVTTIALECGISHLGRFASAYARRFGEQPSETLRRARDARQPISAA